MKDEFEVIALVHGCDILKNEEYKKYNLGDTVHCRCGKCEIRKFWELEEIEAAKEELKCYWTFYSNYDEDYILVDEWALAFCQLDDDGNIVKVNPKMIFADIVNKVRRFV